MLSVADQIIQGELPNLEAHLAQGGAINDIDEYGFTFLIESAIALNIPAMEVLIRAGADINKQDVTGRTALNWAVDSNQLEQTKILLEAGADPNIPTRAAQSPLVFPLLRDQWALKQLLYEHGASLPFALDFINAKLLGHRFELNGTVDIISAKGAFVELDYEGFYLEFSLAAIQHSLSRFGSNFAFRELRVAFNELGDIIHAFFHASQLIQYQDSRMRKENFQSDIQSVFASHLLILPVAYQGHAITFVKCGSFLAKCDRGENALKEGSVNIYWIGNMKMWNSALLKTLLYQKQNKAFVHQQINQVLDLKPVGQMPLSYQKAGNCSWANVEATVPVSYVLLQLVKLKNFNPANFEESVKNGMRLHSEWLSWDKDRALEECIQSFYESDTLRKASKAAILGAVLFQGCRYSRNDDIKRAEKILKILMLKDYRYILKSYIRVFCDTRLTVLGKNLLKILDDFGIDRDGL